MEKIMKYIFLSLIFLYMVILSACSKEVEKSELVDRGDELIQIGMSFDSFVIERWTRDKEVFVATASNLGADVNVQNANGDLNTQIEQIRYFISKKVDAIVIIAVDSDSLSDVVLEAKQAGIKVIAYDRLINYADIDLYISFDNEKVGMLMAEALMKATGNEGSYIMLCGPTTDNNVARVVEGFESKVAQENINIVARMNADGWKAEKAYDYLDANEDILASVDGIMCGNDNLATQAVKYLSEKGLAGTIPIVGQDADLEACQRIVEGTQEMTVFKPVEQLAIKAAQYVVQLIENNDFASNFESINNGEYSCHTSLWIKLLICLVAG